MIESLLLAGSNEAIVIRRDGRQSQSLSSNQAAQVLVSQEQRDERVPASVYTDVRGLVWAAGASWLKRRAVC